MGDWLYNIDNRKNIVIYLHTINIWNLYELMDKIDAIIIAFTAVVTNIINCK